MGYLDIELGIKSVSGIKKYLQKHFKTLGYTIDLDCVKVANSVRTFWAIDNTLHTYDMKGSVIHIMQESDLEGLIVAITNSLPTTVNIIETITRGCCDNCGEGFDNEAEWRYNTECEVCGEPIPKHLINKRL